jgi:hypothetical protein
MGIKFFVPCIDQRWAVLDFNGTPVQVSKQILTKDPDPRFHTKKEPGLVLQTNTL